MSGGFYSYWFGGLNKALTEMDGQSVDTLMTRCGRACSDSFPKQVYVEQYRAAADLDDFIARLNGIFGEMDMRRTGPDEIEIVYTRCACDLVRDGYITDPTLCLCSLRGLAYNWEAILGEGSVSCRLEQTILGGGDCCRFHVKLLPGERNRA